MACYKDKKRNTWFISYKYKDINTGTFKTICKRGFKTQTEAKKWEISSRAALLAEEPIVKDIYSMTFMEVAGLWADTEQSSNESRRQHREHFGIRCKAFKDKKISEIRKEDLILWRTWLSKADWATKTKNMTISYVKSVFNFAENIYNLPNPARVLTKLKKNNDEVLEEMQVWTPEEFEKFLEYVNEEEYKVFFEFLFWTGCRRGEAIALQKEDFCGSSVNIKYSQRDATTGLRPTKTKQRRTIQIDKQLEKNMNDLIENRDCDKHELRYENCNVLISKNKSNYVFGGHSALSPTSIDRRFKNAIKYSGVKPIRLHDLRHSHASWLINNGVNIVAVSKRLGHKDVDMTLKTYTHLMEDRDNNLLSKISEFRERNAQENRWSGDYVIDLIKPLKITNFPAATVLTSNPCFRAIKHIEPEK